MQSNSSTTINAKLTNQLMRNFRRSMLHVARCFATPPLTAIRKCFTHALIKSPFSCYFCSVTSRISNALSIFDYLSSLLTNMPLADFAPLALSPSWIIPSKRTSLRKKLRSVKLSTFNNFHRTWSAPLKSYFLIDCRSSVSSAGDNEKDAGALPQYHVDKSFADRRYKVSSARTYFYLNEATCERNMEIFIKCLEAVSGKLYPT